MAGQVHPQHPDWWKATDGLWYPPEQHPMNRQQPAPRSDFRRAMNAGFGIGCGLLVLAFVLLVGLAVLMALAV